MCVREAMPPDRGHPHRLAVLGLPCESSQRFRRRQVHGHALLPFPAFLPGSAMLTDEYGLSLRPLTIGLVSVVLHLCCQLGTAQEGDAKPWFEQGNQAIRKGDAAEA